MKKKTIIAALALLLALPGMAQTNFRPITYDEAIAAAKAEGKLVFMDFYTDWCGPCKRMMNDVFPQPSVGDYMNGKFVCIKLNAEKEGKELAVLYGVKAYPTFVGIDTSKKVLFTKVGGATADAFVADIDRLLDPDRTPERMEARYEKGERTPALISSYASYLTNIAYEEGGDRSNADKADKMVRDYFAGLTDAERLSPDNLFLYTTYAHSVNDSIARFWVAHRDDFDVSVQPRLKEAFAQLYMSDICNYLSGQTPYDAAAYGVLKRETNELGFNADKRYDPCFRLIETYAKGDMEAYLAVCREEYPKMDATLRNTLLNSFATLFEGKEKSVCMEASKFLRGLLFDMDVNDMMFIPYQIMQLEGKGH